LSLPEPFRIRIEDWVLDDLRARIRQTRWPGEIPDVGWTQGVPLGYMQSMLGFWADGFDWRRKERELNSWPHFRIELDGIAIHFIHQRAHDGNGIPLILTHGWPSAFIELLPLLPLLTDPAGNGLSGPSFDVVVPSLPGYGFSGRPQHPRVNYRYVAKTWHALMHALGYERYGAAGGDFGAGVTTFMGLDQPERVMGIHLWTAELEPDHGTATDLLSAAERYLADAERWWSVEGGYKAIQSTRPQTLGYGLNDSPAGLAAWILEKWLAWSDPRSIDTTITREFLLTLLTIYWTTQTINSSMRDYFDNRWNRVELGPQVRVSVPSAFALYPSQAAAEPMPPREFLERLYDIRRWTVGDAGGHFAPLENPHHLARELAAFFGQR
jgi:pimeloyl-ACP methyl ester carboxylesterase